MKQIDQQRVATQKFQGRNAELTEDAQPLAAFENTIQEIAQAIGKDPWNQRHIIAGIKVQGWET